MHADNLTSVAPCTESPRTCAAVSDANESSVTRFAVMIAEDQASVKRRMWQVGNTNLVLNSSYIWASHSPMLGCRSVVCGGSWTDKDSSGGPSKAQVAA